MPRRQEAGISIAMMFQKRDADCPAGALFYTCALNHFRGCCTTDPCQSPGGCEDTWSAPSETSFTAHPLPTTAQATSTTGTTFLATTTEWPTTIAPLIPSSTDASLLPSSTEIPPPKSTKELPVALIAGLSVGVVAATASIGLFIWICRGRRRPVSSHVARALPQQILYPPPPAHVFELEGSSVPVAGLEKRVEHSDGTRHEMSG